MKSNIKVGDVMTRNFVSIKPNESVVSAAKKMIQKRVGSLIIEEKKKLMGLVTQRDIIYALIKKSKNELAKTPVIDIAVKKITTTKPSADIYEAMARMKKTKHRWLPAVINGDVVGMLTIKDIINLEPELLESISAMTEIREETEKRNKIEESRKGKGFETEGVCDECGNVDILYRMDGMMVCGSCREAID